MPDIASIKPQLENILKREKKAKMIAEKYKGKTNLDEIAAANQTQVMTADTVNYMQGSATLSGEPKVIGAAFAKIIEQTIGPKPQPPQQQQAQQPGAV